ncbi:MAG: hypothetical protein CL579_17780 [Alteromonadaceae bacterium]|uniref:Uncharacterized protein n=1 Tax=Paraglaciecola chathamensis TaxID=368405 RepID=A0A8H9M388_9ALTE|nr:hypothetical protein Glaag_4371 [Glaciecola sp. 4H-3-7+YE-5]MAD17890.1 hypothetical protein [Alteromonadaceae bacterium]MBB20382.1 hypothetical protein [Rickettsiales bacterium]GGZ82777.1 hypothetical protein GCM10011274_45610 [Paraglaciecola oceanifecundans]
MLNLKILALAIGSTVICYFLFKILIVSYQTGIAQLKYGNSVTIEESPPLYWASLGLSLFLALVFLYAALGFFKILFDNE